MFYTSARCFAFLLSFMFVTGFGPLITSQNLSPLPSKFQLQSSKMRPNTYRCTATTSKSQMKLFGSANSDPVPGIGDEGCQLPSPSLVNTLPIAGQAAVFFGSCLALYGGTVGCIAGIEALKHSFPDTMSSWMTSWPLLGPIYMAAGLAHFSMAEGFMNMMPVQGAWGFWYLPGSKKFHVSWTGIAEFVGGLILTIGATSNLLFGISLPDAFQLGSGSLISDASLGLLALTIAVTPANIYMFTHGALLPPSMMEQVPLPGHALRAVLQVLLFAIFYEMAIPTLYKLENLIV